GCHASAPSSLTPTTLSRSTQLFSAAHPAPGMAKTRWYQERQREGYYRQAKKEGYRARSAYKLQQVDGKYGLLRRGAAVVGTVARLERNVDPAVYQLRITGHPAAADTWRLQVHFTRPR
ncbi:MAG TPA: hypothetical protein VHI93_04710, partial [Candidatus Thermoplasmatota archaeon]|nr:hypothetical protein [Candidatus Thermoplasmatota archaeon]